MAKFMPVLKNPRAMPYVGVAAAVFIWIFDSLVDHFWFHPDEPLLESFWPDHGIEIWMRLLVAGVCIGLSLYARVLLRSEARARAELASYQAELERLVEERTSELSRNYEILKTEVAERQRMQAELEMLAITDPLTQLYNRRKFMEILEQELERSARYASSFALILLDIDHFKRVNDQFGHDVGDEVLRQLSRVVLQNLRKSDVVARWGGEEFILLAPLADAGVGRAIADKLRTAVRDEPLAGALPIAITISLGIALAVPGDAAGDLIKRADNALYQAKHRGRNRAVLEEAGNSPFPSAS